MKLYKDTESGPVEVPLEDGIYHAVFAVATEIPEPDPDVEPDPDTPQEPQPTSKIFMPAGPTSVGNAGWQFYVGEQGGPGLSVNGAPFPLSYMTPRDDNFTPVNPARLMVYLHPDDNESGAFVLGASSYKFSQSHVEIHPQVQGGWWVYSGANVGAVGNYNGAQIGGAVDYVLGKYGDRIAVSEGIHLRGKSLGGGGVMHQCMLLDNVAIVDCIIGPMMIPKNDRNKVASSWGTDEALYDSVDFRQQWSKVQDAHFSWRGGSDDSLGTFDLEFIQLCEQHKISCSAVWLRSGHGITESGYSINTNLFTDSRQDATLDKILPVITNNTANHHGDVRGYHNRGISWDHSGIVDTASRITVPLKYVAAKAIGPELPDQPDVMTCSVTLRHVKQFAASQVAWQFGDQTGVVPGDGLITIDGLQLTSGAGYVDLIVTQASGIPSEPEPEPEPEPNPGTKPSAIRKAVNEAALLNFDDWNGSSRYTRSTSLTVWRDDVVNVDFDCQNMSTAGGGGRRVLEGSVYTMLDHRTRKVLATVEVEPGAKTGRFLVDTTGLAAGPIVADISEHGAETSVPYVFYVVRPGEPLPPQDFVPVYTGSHEIHEWFNLDWIPVKHSPLPWPLPDIQLLPFDPTVDEDNLIAEPFTASITGHPRILNKNKDGIYSTVTKQRYFWSDVIAKYPVIEMLDGPRGANTLAMVTHISPGTARLEDTPESPLVGNWYVATPWSFCRVGKDGKVTTLAGYYHDTPAPYYDDETIPNLRGDWTEIDPDRHGFHLIWGMCWLKKTLATDKGAELIPDLGILRTPHITGPTALLADSKNNAIRSVEFSPITHGAEPKIREFYRGAEGADVWDCVQWGDKTIVSERGAHRVIQLDSDGNFERVVLQGAALATISYLHVAKRTATLEEVREEDIVAPEGLYIIPGDDWCYVGSAAMKQVRRVHLVTGELEVVKEIRGNRNLFAKIAVTADRTVLVMNWEISPPQATRAGTRLLLPRGGGSHSYNMAVGCSGDSILYSSVMQGIKRIRLKTPEDAEIDQSQFNRGEELWKSSGYYLKYGPSGESLFGLPLPWGEDADIDYYLRVMGH